MASPTFGKRTPNSSNSPQAIHPQPGISRLPLSLRRWSAWVIEVSLVATSAWVPFQVGLYAQAQYRGEPVPLNLMLATAEEAIARTLAIPVGDSNQRVAPLSNLLWSGALLAPIVIVGSQIYLLSKTGRTLPKGWLGLQVVTAAGSPPSLDRVLIREGMGRWGLPLGIAYVIWRYSGAFPGLGILAGLAGLMISLEGLTVQLNRQRRGLHDRLAGTFVLDVAQIWQPYTEVQNPEVQNPEAQNPEVQTLYPVQHSPYSPSPAFATNHGWSTPGWPTSDWTDEDGAIAAIVLAPDTHWSDRSLWRWMRHHPGTALLTFSSVTLFLILGTLVGTQVYIQNQTNWRELQQQRNQMYLALVNQLGPTPADSVEERRAAILALGTVDDPRAIPLLVDLLAQEQNPVLVGAIHQALVSVGPDALRRLHQLNQSLKTEIASLQVSRQPQELNAASFRQRATQRAIAKVLTLHSGQMRALDLSRVQLGQVISGPAQFTLVLDQTDLAGIVLRDANLAGASLRNTRFYGPGLDERFGTFDDWTSDLSGAELKSANLSQALLDHTRLNQTSLVGANLNKASLIQARLIAANLSSADLTDANLQQAVLENSSLTGANLSDAVLTQANLRRANLGQVQAVGVQLQSADLRQSDWRGSNLSRADLSRANLTAADLSSSLLDRANLRDANLQNASLRDVDLSSANLRGANLRGTDFRGAVFSPSTTSAPDQFIQIHPLVDKEGGLQGVDFRQAQNLDANQIIDICTQGGILEECL